jgi:hypothetical protein
MAEGGIRVHHRHCNAPGLTENNVRRPEAKSERNYSEL